jgi:hypothetical protein
MHERYQAALQRSPYDLVSQYSWSLSASANVFFANFVRSNLNMEPKVQKRYGITHT